MKRVSLLALLVLTGCPSWETERLNRCRELDASTGACEGSGAGDERDAGAIDAGPLDAGGVDAGGVDAGMDAGGMDAGNTGSDIDALPRIVPSSTDTIYGESFGRERLTVLLHELPSGVVLAAESYVASDGGHLSIWRSSDFMATSDSPLAWCASAASGDEVGNAYGGTSPGVRVDRFAGTVVNSEYGLTGCADALAASQRADAGSSYLGISAMSTAIRVERTSCNQCSPENNFSITLQDPLVGEAVTDENQTVWIAAAGGPNRTNLYVTRIDPDAVSGAAPRRFGTSNAPLRVQLSTSGSRVHAAWLEGPLLSITELSLDGGTDLPVRFTLSEPGRLVDLVESRKSVVAILEFDGGRNALLIHQATSDSLFAIATPTIAFHPAIAHLGTQLRIAGQCDAGANCESPARNPLLEFALLPDGSSW